MADRDRDPHRRDIRRDDRRGRHAGARRLLGRVVRAVQDDRPGPRGDRRASTAASSRSRSSTSTTTRTPRMRFNVMSIPTLLVFKAASPSPCSSGSSAPRARGSSSRTWPSSSPDATHALDRPTVRRPATHAARRYATSRRGSPRSGTTSPTTSPARSAPRPRPRVRAFQDGRGSAGRRRRRRRRPGPRSSRAASRSATGSSTSGHPMLRGDDVAELQRRLNALGFDAGREDGIFGTDTNDALVEFQRSSRPRRRRHLRTLDHRRALDRVGRSPTARSRRVRERERMRARPAPPRGPPGVRRGGPRDSPSSASRSPAASRDAGADRGPRRRPATTTRLVAREANRFGADLFLGPAHRRRPRAGAARTSRPAAFRSEAGYAAASAIREASSRACSAATAASRAGPTPPCGRRAWPRSSASWSPKATSRPWRRGRPRGRRRAGDRRRHPAGDRAPRHRHVVDARTAEPRVPCRRCMHRSAVSRSRRVVPRPALRSSGGRSARDPRAPRSRPSACPCRPCAIRIFTRVSRWSPSSSSSSSQARRAHPARGRYLRSGRPSRRRCARAPSLRPTRTDRSSFSDPLGQQLLERPVGRAEQRTRVTHRELSLAHHALDRRRQLEQAQRVRDRGTAACPTRDATCSWVSWKSSMSCWYAAASSSGLSSSRWTFSTSACSSAVLSSVSRTSAGIDWRPTRLAARHRRSPAISS